MIGLPSLSIWFFLLSSIQGGFAAPNPSSVRSSAITADQQKYLDIHNSLRAKHNASPLTWDASLAQKAQNWANGCKFAHSGSGENLAAGTGGFTIEAALKAWADEESSYTGDWSPASGHYTQMVWKSTTKLGCAVKTGCTGIFGNTASPANYYVCEYSPAGNVLGAFPQNVS